ncbi:LADA_0C02520g1_1 [Lachancea dasiensis]|uniref:LADA_0C02520g1_1 n=1 Tax=Lachancea dasiensis TaxID=1072105 RepID=A0A1G4IYL3_9SACH|nr:LADA_0C02520g1_1 [Lachancea dasiensis]
MFLSSWAKRALPRVRRTLVLDKLRPIRTYSRQAAARKKDELPSFTKIALVGLVGSIIFVEAVKSLEKNKPKNSYSESEFATAMQGVKRREVMFKPGDIHIQLATVGIPIAKLRKSNPNASMVDPWEVAEHYRHSQDDRYYALLNEIHEIYGENYLDHLPQGLGVVLVGRYLQDKFHGGDHVVVINFPLSVKDAIKFENEVSVVENVYFGTSSAETDLAQYYQTVNKVQVLG